MRSNFFTTTFNQITNSRIRFHRYKAEQKASRVPEPAARLMCVLAHPDDESLCMGGTLAKYAAEGIEIALVVATRGERGWRGDADQDPGMARVGEMREGELRRAAQILGVREIRFLNYVDGELDSLPEKELVSKIMREIMRFRPDVVITFDPHGMYGHPDHLAVGHATTNAVWQAGDPNQPRAHRVQKLYYRVFTEGALAAYQETFGELKMQVREYERGVVAWQPWAITTQIETLEFSDAVWNAIASHRSQVSSTAALRRKFGETRRAELGIETYFRVLGQGTRGRKVEDDLLDGITASALQAAF